MTGFLAIHRNQEVQGAIGDSAQQEVVPLLHSSDCRQASDGLLPPKLVLLGRVGGFCFLNDRIMDVNPCQAALAFGLSLKKALSKHLVDPRPLLGRLGLV